MKKIYHLSTCDTCRKILKEIDATKKKIELQDIKSNPVTPQQLDEMKELAGSYEALFSRKAVKYRTMGLAEKDLTEKDYLQLILSEYTFLKRPVAIAGNQIFIGNTKASIEALKNAL
ncbi:arsenate reductase family protein [Flavihumibacter profundi]|uniref:arsenate reductase family protein n=1 Tax=Flavihumibacter profundi TaxID=2716883 RepID=UPI001CC640B2|nr:ArsC/Spx/MgsR family protein [Flavihumibacter profundi]MBZ5857852.1 arsenate reductase [Flavihumibacter profundi]